MKALDCLSPKSSNFLQLDVLKPLVTHLGIDFNELSNEVLNAKRVILRKLPSDEKDRTVISACKIVNEFKNVFPELIKVYGGGFTFEVKRFL